MIALNDDTLFVGQIKQLLYEFNLPNCSVGFKNPAANRHFIANGYINLWKETKNKQTGKSSFTYEKICPYKYNKKYLNLTTTLPTRNLIYDRETHRYLGRYLRFIRDFRNVNLMSMYNCFDGDIFEGDVSIKRRIQRQDNIDTNNIIRFKNNEGGFSVFSVPVDFQKLTLRISDGNMAYACLCVDNIDMRSTGSDAKMNQELMDITLTKFHANEVVNYDPVALVSRNLGSNLPTSSMSLSNMLEFISKNIRNLKLLIRVTRKSDVKITVLEGTYQINNTLTNKYFVIEPLEDAYAPILFPRYIDVPSYEDLDKSTYDPDIDPDDPYNGTDPYTGYVVDKNSENPILLDSDGYPVDFNNSKSDGSTFGDAANEVRFGLVQGSDLNSDLYEILFIRYLVDPKDNDAFKNPTNLKESGFLIIPQLLQQNDTMQDQYMLADRLIEYLAGNVICPLSADYDIRRLQVSYAKNGYDIFNRNLAPGKYIYGVWNPVDLYNTRKLIADNYHKIDNIFDIIGYIDKDVEKLLGDKLDVI